MSTPKDSKTQDDPTEGQDGPILWHAEVRSPNGALLMTIPVQGSTERLARLEAERILKKDIYIGRVQPDALQPRGRTPKGFCPLCGLEGHLPTCSKDACYCDSACIHLKPNV